MMRITIRVNADVIEDIVITNQGARSASADLLEARPDARIYHWGTGSHHEGQLLHYRDEGFITLARKVLAQVAAARGLNS